MHSRRPSTVSSGTAGSGSVVASLASRREATSVGIDAELGPLETTSPRKSRKLLSRSKIASSSSHKSVAIPSPPFTKPVTLSQSPPPPRPSNTYPAISAQLGGTKDASGSGVVGGAVADKGQNTDAKKRSLWRNGSTASSPDLSGLIRAGQSHGQAHQTSQERQSGDHGLGGGSASRVGPPGLNGMDSVDAESRTGPRITPSPDPAHVPPNRRPSTSSTTTRLGPPPTYRDRSASHGGTIGRGLSTSPSVPMNAVGGGGLTAVASWTATDGDTAAGAGARHDEHGLKSMRSRARGMFGRMFGSATSKEGSSSSVSYHASSSQHSLSSNHSSRFGTLSSSATPPPAVPPLPATYARRSTSTASPVDERKNVTPTQARRGSASAVVGRESTASGGLTPLVGVDKPLPPILGFGGRSASAGEVDTIRSRGARISQHVRQPATRDNDAEEMLQRTPSKFTGVTSQQEGNTSADSAKLSPALKRTDSSSPGRQEIRQWGRDVEGILEGDGIEANLARELGLPPESVSHPPMQDSPTKKRRSQVPKFDDAESATTSSIGHASLNSSEDATETKKNGPRYASRTSSLPSDHRRYSPEDAHSASSLVDERSVPIHEPNKVPSNELEGSSADETIIAPVSTAIDGDVTITAKGHAATAIDTPVDTDFGPHRGSEAIEPIGHSARLVQTPSAPHDSPVRWRLQSASEVQLADGLPELGRSLPWGSNESAQCRDSSASLASRPMESPHTEEPSADDAILDEEGRKMACEFLEEDDSHVPQDRVAEYLGGIRPVSKYALKHYMAYFNFAGLRVDEAFRQFCQKLYLKAETQEIDRILEGFSARYFECNPTTIFGSPTIIHVVTGSFLLLNTDLHIADITQHMSRNQFVKLTFDTIYANMPPSSERSSTPELIRDDSSSATQIVPSSGLSQVPPPNGGTSVQRSVSTPRGPRTTSVYSNLSAKDSLSGPTLSATHLSSGAHPGQEPKSRLGSSTSIGSSLFNKGWEAEVEGALKDIYAAVKAQQILLPVSNPVLLGAPHGTLGAGLNAIRRKASGRNSSAGSNERVSSFKRGSVRGMQGMLGASPYGISHLAADGRVSPTPSYATSIGEGFPSHIAAPSIGFASNLSHTVIKEQEDENASTVSGLSDGTLDELDDDELALLGAPWAKEGNLSRKPYWEAPGKRSKDKAWKQTFVVIQKGDLSMFTFGETSSKAIAGGAVGGGNWMANARGQGEMNLSHALASALPPPGYNASRPYCLSLTLPTGEMSFFQAGTEELVQEWVATCNYWAARRSRPPLPGGVSNVEYGWNRFVEVTEGQAEHDDAKSFRSERSVRSRLSMQATRGRRNGNAAIVERMHIADWRAPQASLIPSPLDEETQLESLQKHLQLLHKELEQHTLLEEPMSQMYAVRGANSTRAKENWRNKSLFIHSEIVKYETYVDALKSAISLRLKKQGERKLERSLAQRLVSVDDEEVFGVSIQHRQLSVSPQAAR